MKKTKDLFPCPSLHSDIKSEDLLVSTWFWLGLESSKFFASLIAILFSLAFFQLFIIIMISFAIKDLYKIR